MLELPAGRFDLRRPLTLTRPQTVLRGAGAGKTTLHISKSLSEYEGACSTAAAGCRDTARCCVMPLPLTPLTRHLPGTIQCPPTLRS